MSDSQVDASFDEEQYANDSFETEVPESSYYYSEDDITDVDQKGNQQSSSKESNLNKKPPAFQRSADFMTCESSSEEDEVVLGETIAEINTEPFDYEEDDNLSLTPAERVFQMASESRRLQTMLNGIPTPPNSKDIEDDDEYNLSECEDFDEEVNDGDLERENTDAEEIFRKYTKLTTDDEFIYEEEIIYESGMDLEEEYCDVGIENGGEIDVGEPNVGEELGEEEEEDDQELFDKVTDDDEEDGDNIEKQSVSSQSENDEVKINTLPNTQEDNKNNNNKDEEATSDDNQSESKSLNANDSMESFKRRVMLSERIRCQSEGAGDCSNFKTRPIKSNIPIWTGHNRLLTRLEGGRDANEGPSMRVIKAKVSKVLRAKSESNEKERNIDMAAGGDNNVSMNTTDGFTDYGSSCESQSYGYSMEMSTFMKSEKAPKPPKKLKAGERRNKSFSNDRLRDIERHNHLLLRKIINQKPTYDFSEKKKKSDKFASLPQTTRLSSSAINRKKQERQIAMDNILFKRKLDAILQRKPKPKTKA